MHTNDELPHEHSAPVDAEHPGYEISDANVGGVAVFLAGLFGFVLIFFGVCFLLGRMINTGIQKSYVEDYGEQNKWHGGHAKKGDLENLASNPKMQQEELGKLTASFPSPRLDIDDGNESTAELHAREDLLLDHYSVATAGGGTIRIPISRAMELIAQRGLPVNAAVTTSAPLTGDVKPAIQAPLTSGFARTGYEYEVIAAREQKMSYGKADENAKAEPAAAK